MQEKKRSVEEELFDMYLHVSGSRNFAELMFRAHSFYDSIHTRIGKAFSNMSDEEINAIKRRFGGVYPDVASDPTTQFVKTIREAEFDIYRRHENIYGTVAITNYCPQLGRMSKL